MHGQQNIKKNNLDKPGYCNCYYRSSLCY